MSVGENGEIVHKTDELARQFHERYEEIAPLYGYKTRADTKVFDPESPNGRLMRAVCLQVVGPIIAERDEAVEREIVAIESWDEERKRAIREGERVLEAREKYFAMRDLSNNATELAEKYKQERDKFRHALRVIARMDTSRGNTRALLSVAVAKDALGLETPKH